MKIAALQMTSRTVPEDNLHQASELLSEAAEKKCCLAVLPENFSYLGQFDADRIAAAEAPGSGPAQDFLSREAKRTGLWIVGGTIPIRGPAQRVYSRSLCVGPDGHCVAQYDKLHLFDVDVPNANGERYRESDTTIPGEIAVVATAQSMRIGMSVCYDLRFPMLFHRLGVLGMNILAVPAAFTVPTGKVHWLALLRARAIESLVYVVAAGQWGEHAGGRKTYGHSAIISPWGEILAIQQDEIGVVCAEIDIQHQQELRQQFPSLKHRREL